MALVVKNPPANTGDPRDTGSILGLGRSPGVGNGNPLQYSCLENYMDRGAWQVIVIQTSKVAQVVKNLPANARDTRDVEFDSWVRKIPWRRKYPLRYSCLGTPIEEPDRLQSRGFLKE